MCVSFFAYFCIIVFIRLCLNMSYPIIYVDCFIAKSQPRLKNKATAEIPETSSSECHLSQAPGNHHGPFFTITFGHAESNQATLICPVLLSHVCCGPAPK